MATRTWFLCRSVNPTSNSAEIVHLESVELPWREVALLKGSVFQPEENCDREVQVLHVFTPEQGKIIEGIESLTLQNTCEPFSSFEMLLTGLAMDCFVGINDLNKLLRRYQRKKYKKVSHFLKRSERYYTSSDPMFG